MSKRKNDGGKRILDGLNETLAWAEGRASATIHFPGEPPREMTRDEYEAHKRRLTFPPSQPDPAGSSEGAEP